MVDRLTLTIKVSVVAVLAVLLLSIGRVPASSRAWKPTADKLAAEYSVISDNRPSGDLIFVMWFSPPIVRDDTPNAVQIRALLDKYIFIAVAHGHLDKTTGVTSFQNVESLSAQDEAGKPLALVERNSMPPTTAGAVAVVERMFQQMLGAVGKGMKMFVFEAGDVHACQKGKLSIPFAGETYTWETPIPGCRQSG